MTTHLIDEMENLFEDIVLLDRGRVRATGSVDEFRGSAVTLTGAWERVEPLLPKATVLRVLRVGAMASVIAENGDGLAEAASAAGVAVEPTGLRSLVAAYGLDSSEVSA